MVKVIVNGAAGRMGRLLVKNIIEDESMELAGATEYKENPLLGSDAGTVAGLTPCGIVLSDNLKALLPKADVLIDFSTGPVIENAKVATKQNVAVVIGTTALNNEEKNVLKELSKNGGRIVCSPNMSVGVNVLFHLCSEVAKILNDDYDIEIVEYHHNQKKDAPSGTALRLAEVIAESQKLDLADNACYGREGNTGLRDKNEIGIHAVRCGDIVGDHTVTFATQGERVELTHKASSRETFSKGAIRAAKFISSSKPGYYDMNDVLKFA